MFIYTIAISFSLPLLDVYASHCVNFLGLTFLHFCIFLYLSSSIAPASILSVILVYTTERWRKTQVLHMGLCSLEIFLTLSKEIECTKNCFGITAPMGLSVSRLFINKYKNTRALTIVKIIYLTHFGTSNSILTN